MTHSTVQALSASSVLAVSFLFVRALHLMPALWGFNAPAPIVLTVVVLLTIAAVAWVFDQWGVSGLRPLWLMALTGAATLTVFVSFEATREHVGSSEATIALTLCTLGLLGLGMVGKEAARDPDVFFLFGMLAFATPFIVIGVAELPSAVPLVLCIVFISLWRKRRIAQAALHADLGI